MKKFKNPYEIAAMGASVGAQFLPQQSNPYRTDQLAGVRGASAGYQAGASFGLPGAVIGAGVGATAGTLLEYSQTRQALNNINTGVAKGGLDIYGAPTYNSQGALQAQNTLTDLDDASGSSGSGGRAASAALSPLGGISALLEGKNRRKARDKRDELQTNLTNMQQNFNEDNIDFQRSEIAKRSYLDKQKNIYNFPYQLI
jgi:hypothetical protein